MGLLLRVLVVEDSEDDALLMLKDLQRAGYDVVHERVDTAAALEAAIASREWDLVLADYSMPRFSGTAALQQLQKSSLDLPFIFVSGSIGEETAVEAMKMGAHDYVMKGNLHRLVPAIQRELREAEIRRERRHAEREIRELQKFELMGKLAGGVAHDFNNVIGAVIGWAEIGAEGAQGQPELAEAFQQILKEGERAAGLTRQLLAFARRQVLEPRYLELNLTVTNAESLLRRIIGSHIEIQTRLSSDSTVIFADPTQMEQVLINLCVNARDAMPNGGRLRIQTSRVIVEDVPGPGDYVLLEVSDTGTGIAADTLEHIFEPFFTTKQVGEGTGLGLSTVQGIVQQHAGTIEVLSEVGRGTTFRAYLPARTGTAEPPKRLDHVSTQRGNETILVAEDNEGLRRVAELMLVHLGYRVLLAEDGLEAVRVFTSNLEQIDLAILDVMMPLMGGLDVYEKMREMKPGLAVILATGYSADAMVVRRLKEDGATILQKPYGAAILGQKVREALDRRK
jgi:two-component system cell cycle sensor histidine kinase/response regulator CckA